MAKSYEMIDHTADAGLEARADTLAELLEALAEGMADVICPPSSVAPRARRTVAVVAEDLEAAAVDFLSAVLKVIQVEHFMVAKVTVREATSNALSAEVAGEPYDPAKHELAREIKAVTYHQLKIARVEDGRWFGRVIFDL
jgi:SHS2 domain-containing protein